ncbi:MAG: DUF559 domain-containing protein [Croceibacterium sp.]
MQFTRQFPIGPSIVDFACRRLKLAIELDGRQHAESHRDEARSQLIEAHGYPGDQVLEQRCDAEYRGRTAALCRGNSAGAEDHHWQVCFGRSSNDRLRPDSDKSCQSGNDPIANIPHA